MCFHSLKLQHHRLFQFKLLSCLDFMRGIELKLRHIMHQENVFFGQVHIRSHCAILWQRKYDLLPIRAYGSHRRRFPSQDLHLWAYKRVKPITPFCRIFTACSMLLLLVACSFNLCSTFDIQVRHNIGQTVWSELRAAGCVLLCCSWLELTEEIVSSTDRILSR